MVRTIAHDIVERGARWARWGALCALAASPGCNNDRDTKATTPEPATSPATRAETPESTPTLASAAASPRHGGRAPTPAVAMPEPIEDVTPSPTIPDEPYSVLIVGDSLAATGIGALLERQLDAHPHIVAHRKGKSASGLARPDFFDWMAEAKRQVELHDPDLVIVAIGGNDGQDLTRLPGRHLGDSDPRRVGWKDEAWADAYRERVDAFLQQLRAGGDGRKILWLGLPTMGLTSLEKKLTLIRDVQQNAVEALGDEAIYLDTISWVSDDTGALRTDVVVGGKAQPMRAEDRIHFTMAGSQYFADAAVPAVLEALALRDVEPED